MSDPFIFCENLVKVYKVAELEQVALQGLNLSVQPGELLGIIGASGSGKSTLMSILGGLDRPTAGKVQVDGQDLLRMPDRHLNRYRREHVGFVWQQSARNLVPYLNALRNVMLPMTLAGETGRNQKKRAQELLEMVGLGPRMHHHLPELSGGEQQRVAIAVALANRPSLLLGDEPTGEVDSATAQLIYDTFRYLTSELGVTTLIVSHDPGIARHVDRVVRIRDGMLASETRRQLREPDPDSQNDHTKEDHSSQLAADEEGIYEELVVLDKAGRIHIPQEYLEETGIHGRARLEITANGILVQPATATETEETSDNVTKAGDKKPPGPVTATKGRFSSLMGRFRGQKK